MHKHTPAPVQVRETHSVASSQMVACVDGRFVGSAFLFGRHDGYPRHQQWARAFLSGVRLAPFVAGVRA